RDPRAAWSSARGRGRRARVLLSPTLSHVSLPMGSVRFTERYGEDVERCSAEAHALLLQLSPRAAIGVAGTVTQLAAFETESVHGYKLSRARAREQLQRL